MIRDRFEKGDRKMKYNGWEDQEWLDYFGMNDDDPYDPFDGSED